MANEKRDLRLKRNNTKDKTKRAEMAKQRNKLGRLIKLTIIRLENERLDVLTEEAEQLKDGAKMFRAVKERQEIIKRRK